MVPRCPEIGKPLQIIRLFEPYDRPHRLVLVLILLVRKVWLWEVAELGLKGHFADSECSALSCGPTRRPLGPIPLPPGALTLVTKISRAPALCPALAGMLRENTEQDRPQRMTVMPPGCWSRARPALIGHSSKTRFALFLTSGSAFFTFSRLFTRVVEVTELQGRKSGWN